MKVYVMQAVVECITALNTSAKKNCQKTPVRPGRDRALARKEKVM